MKKVLIALDYDPLAEKVAATGYSIAKAMGADVLLLHVIMEPAYYSSTAYSPIMGFSGFTGPDDTAELVKDLEKEGYRFLQQCRKQLGDENIRIAAIEGDFAESIIDAANEFEAELIVMGTQHRKGLDKLLMGNLATTILDKSAIPVLVIPSPSVT